MSLKDIGKKLAEGIRVAKRVERPKTRKLTDSVERKLAKRTGIVSDEEEETTTGGERRKLTLKRGKLILKRKPAEEGMTGKNHEARGKEKVGEKGLIGSKGERGTRRTGGESNWEGGRGEEGTEGEGTDQMCTQGQAAQGLKGPKSPSKAIILQENQLSETALGTPSVKVSMTRSEVRRLPVLDGPPTDVDLEIRKLKKVPGVHCSVCHIGADCEKYEEGKVCYFNPAFDAFEVRDVGGVLGLMRTIVDKNKQRLWRSYFSEATVNGGAVMPEVTTLSGVVLGQLKGLLELEREASRATVHFEGPTDEIAGDGEKKEGILARLFGGGSVDSTTVQGATVESSSGREDYSTPERGSTGSSVVTDTVESTAHIPEVIGRADATQPKKLQGIVGPGGGGGGQTTVAEASGGSYSQVSQWAGDPEHKHSQVSQSPGGQKHRHSAEDGTYSQVSHNFSDDEHRHSDLEGEDDVTVDAEAYDPLGGAPPPETEEELETRGYRQSTEDEE